jgi:hypothetical protein
MPFTFTTPTARCLTSGCDRPAVAHCARHTPAPSTVIEWRPASEAGALDGWTVTCVCGTTLSTSLSLRAASRLSEEHLGWHAG